MRRPDRDAMLGALGVALVAAGVAWALLPLAAPWTVAGHSLQLDLVRLRALSAAFAAGDLWPTWLPDLHRRHGSPLPLFYSPLAYLLPVSLIHAGLDAGAALEAAFAAQWIVGVAGAAWAARAWFGDGAAVPAAAAFGLAPYALVDLYSRGALAELFALALLPWALGCVARRGAATLVLGALALAALVVAHNISALLATPALVLVALASPAAQRYRALAMVGLALGLATFFWLPAIAGKSQVWVDERMTSGLFDYRRRLVEPVRLLPFGDVFRIRIEPGRFVPVRLGELLWAGLLAAPLVVARAARPLRARVATLAVVALGSLAMIGRFSRPLWDALPFLPLVGFPFRFLVVATTAAALLIGGAVAAAPRHWRAAAGAAVAVLAVVAALPFRDARYAFLAREPRQMFVVAPESAAAAARNPRLAPPAELIDLELVRALGLPATAADEYLPRVAAGPPARSGRAVEPMTPGVRVLEASWGYPEVRGEVSVTSPGAVALHQFAFPGWSVRVDGVERETAVEAVRGRIVVPVTPGDREIVARFGSTPLRRAAAGASGVAALLLAWLAVVERRRCVEARC